LIFAAGSEDPAERLHYLPRQRRQESFLPFIDIAAYFACW